MPNCKSFLVAEAERKHGRRLGRFQQHRAASSHKVFFFLRGKAPKDIHAILTETLGEHAPLYATVKNWMAQFKSGNFFACVAPSSGRHKTDKIDQINMLILEDLRISSKSVAEQLGISRERVGSIIHEDLEMLNLSAKWVPKCLNADQKRQRCQASEQILEFFLERNK